MFNSGQLVEGLATETINRLQQYHHSQHLHSSSSVSHDHFNHYQRQLLQLHQSLPLTEVEVKPSTPVPSRESLPSYSISTSDCSPYLNLIRDYPVSIKNYALGLSSDTTITTKQSRDSFCDNNNSDIIDHSIRTSRIRSYSDTINQQPSSNSNNSNLAPFYTEPLMVDDECQLANNNSSSSSSATTITSSPSESAFSASPLSFTPETYRARSYSSLVTTSAKSDRSSSNFDSVYKIKNLVGSSPCQEDIINVTTLSPFNCKIKAEESAEENNQCQADPEDSLKSQDCSSSILSCSKSSAITCPAIYSNSNSCGSCSSSSSGGSSSSSSTSSPPPLVATQETTFGLNCNGYSSCLFTAVGSGSSTQGTCASSTLLMPGPVTPSVSLSSASVSHLQQQQQQQQQSVSINSSLFPSGQLSSSYRSSATTAAVTSSSVSTPTNSDIDQYLNVFFSPPSSSSSSSVHPQQPGLLEPLRQSSISSTSSLHYSPSPLQSQPSPFLDSFTPSPHLLSPTSTHQSQLATKSSVNGFITPSSSILTSINSSSLFSPPLSSPSQSNSGKLELNRINPSSSSTTSGRISPPSLSSINSINSSAFLHSRHSHKFASFLPNTNSSGNFIVPSSVASSSFDTSHLADYSPSQSLNSFPACSVSQYPYIDNCFASPSSLYYLSGNHSRQSSSSAIKRPFLNSIYSGSSNQSKRLSASISESSGDDSGFVSTGSPATETFSSPHSSPPQLIPAPPAQSKLQHQSALSSNLSLSSRGHKVVPASLNNNTTTTNNPNTSISSSQNARSSASFISTSSLSVNSFVSPMSAPQALPGGQYGHLTDAAAASSAAAAYSFDDYSALPFSAINSSSWSITNLDQATAAAAVAAAVSQSPTLHHATHPGLSLQAAVPSSQQASALQAVASAVQPLSQGLGHLTSSHQHQGQGLTLKDIKLFSNYPSKSSITNAELRIIKQPETHHRARYMTEGSRGTIKDRTGRGYPVLQLIGYNKSPVKLQCFIGHDQKIGEPHLFYQACEVSGKTPYTFVKVDGFNTIELELLPKNNMQAVFDCMGILKERNVDVERKVLRNRRKSTSTHRPGVNASEEAKMIRNTNKSRSTHCRMVFRCVLPDTGEILQSVSDPILCTQPLGSPEIYKMSLRECDIKGGAELFIIGKNFHKDSKVIFECQATHWRKVIVPQKEFLNSTHLVCQVPSYDGLNAQCLPLVNIDVSVHCNHKNSDPMKFIYTNGFTTSVSNGSMNSQTSAAVAAAYASVCTLRETTTVVANPIATGSNANALFLLERNDMLK